MEKNQWKNSPLSLNQVMAMKRAQIASSSLSDSESEDCFDAFGPAEDSHRNIREKTVIFGNDESFPSCISYDSSQSLSSLFSKINEHEFQNGFLIGSSMNKMMSSVSESLPKCKKILIVDLSGQNPLSFSPESQYLYFSFISSLSLKESNKYRINFDVNLPLKSSDFVTLFYSLLLPISYEYQPQFIFLLLGQSEDSTVISQIAFSLSALASGKLVVMANSGLESVIKVLTGSPPASLISLDTSDTCRNYSHLLSTLSLHWSSLFPPSSYERNREPEIFSRKSDSIVSNSNSIAIVYDKVMCEHKQEILSKDEEKLPEIPERISEIYSLMKSFHLLPRFRHIPSRVANNDELCLVHTKEHVSTMNSLSRLQNQIEISEEASKYNSLYINKSSFNSASVAVGSLLNVVDSVLAGESRCGIALLRPPGHHACSDKPMGFCIFNNVAIAASYALKQSVERILILDWDVHHGNGVQDVFYDSSSVLYISIHRFENGRFFPNFSSGNHTYTGKGRGYGYNVNIPWSTSGLGDSEYSAALFQIILPIATEYNPELILISAGFDAALGDPLGRCSVTPQMFAHMTHQLSGLAGGQIILVLEGGYNLHSISLSMTLCAKALLGDPLPNPLTTSSLNPYAKTDILATKQSLISSWNVWNRGKVSSFEDYVPSEYGAKMSTSGINTLSSRDCLLSVRTTCTASQPNH